jgi:hypothetical protein
MPERRFVLQVRGRHAPGDLAGLDQALGRISSSTVLRAHVRDQAGLHGLLRRVHDLGLDLVELHEASEPAGAPGDGHEVEITVDGPVGELIEATLSDYIGPLHVSSRYSFGNAVAMGEVLTRLLGRGAELEHAGEHTSPGSRF